MAKTLKIKINKQIGGLFIDETGWLNVGFTVSELDAYLDSMPDAKRIIISASSPGGYVDKGLEIYNRLVDLRQSGKEIHVINTAKCYSIMTFIAMAASKGKLFGKPASLWNTHKPMIEPNGTLNADECRRAAQELDSIEAILVEAYSNRTGKSKEYIQNRLREDKIINAYEALAEGWIDEILTDNEVEEEPETPQMKAWKPVAFYNHKIVPLTEETMTEEQENSLAEKIWNKAKGFFNNKAEEAPAQQQEQPAEQTEAAPATPEQAPIPDPKDEELERLRKENADLKAAQEQLQQKETEVQNKETEIQALRADLAAAKAFVPGSGAPKNQTEPTVNVDHGRAKETNSPFAVLENNAKNMRNNRARKSN